VTLRAIPDALAMLAAFRQGQVDGYSYGLPITTQPVVEGTGAIWVDYLTGEVPALTALPSGLVVTTKRYAAAHRDELVRFVTALGRGFDAISADPETVKAVVAAKYFPQLAPNLLNSAFDDARPVLAAGPVPTEAAYQAALKVYNGDQTTKVKVTASFADVMDTRESRRTPSRRSSRVAAARAPAPVCGWSRITPG
jgi:ABC-type nitrate/sulfonate/bicarbonate transport system substrate-binding protein